MEETGLSFSQINILMRLLHGGNTGVSEVGSQLGVTNAAASQAVDRLVQLGLIERTEDPDDRRAKAGIDTQRPYSDRKGDRSPQPLGGGYHGCPDARTARHDHLGIDPADHGGARATRE